MLRSMNSPPDSHDDHLRHLLGQRTTRAHLHGRFSSASEFSDTPSVYSRAFFSPVPLDQGEVDSNTGDSRFNSPSPQSPETLSNHDPLNDPSASMLDLGDDPRASFASSDAYDDEEQDPSHDDCDDEPMPRMSLLGPKMRFHSRAPWEMEEDPLEEGDESDNSASHLPAVSSLTRGRGKDGIVKKDLGFGSPSPRTSSASRPSKESSRSQGKSKASFETGSSQTSNPRGALHALAQASMSSTSLIPPPSPGQSPLRAKFSMGRVKPNSPNATFAPSPLPSSSVRSASNSHPSNAPLSARTPYRKPPHSSQGVTRTNTFSSSAGPSSPSYSDEEENVHPYANPDLVISYAGDPPPLSPSRSTLMFPGFSRSDSSATVTNSPTTSSVSRSGTRCTLTPDTSAPSVTLEQSSQNRGTSLQGKEISSPISIHTNTFPPSSPINDLHEAKLSPLSPKPGVSSLAGWTERGVSPAFTLISLEEARAQRSHVPVSFRSGSSASSARAVPFPEQEQDTTSTVNSVDHSPTSSTPSRSRARSISAGARAKQALHTIVGNSSPKVERRDSDPTVVPNGGVPVRVLKHRKSGFMRLFNSREKEDRVLPPPPPVPTLSDAYTVYNAHQPAQKEQKATIHRIPAVQASPSMTNRSTSPEEFSDPSRDVSTSQKRSPSLKRNPPPLSINTLSQAQVPRPPASALEDTSYQTRTAPSSLSGREWRHNDAAPQSAPANVSEFPALKLRPVSTMFSAHFQDHIVTPDSHSSLEVDLDTLSSQSPSTAISPVTPVLFTRSEQSGNDKSSIPTVSEDQTSVIRALQDQIVTAKMAWQRHIWELEGQVRDLKTEVEDLQVAGYEKEYCTACGRGKQSRSGHTDLQSHESVQETKRAGVVNRPRARTGTSARFGSRV